MPKINSKSEWRCRAIKHYYTDMLKELSIVVKPNQKFLLRDVWFKLECVRHLSSSYGYDIAIAVCTQAVEEGKLNKIGKFYFMSKQEATVAA
jgi:hypothetical protein